MSLPNRAKMEPQSGLFLGVKIIRMHCKTHTSASSHAVPLLIKMQILFFFSKNKLFRNLAFRLDGNLIFGVYILFFSWFLHVFLHLFCCAGPTLRMHLQSISSRNSYRGGWALAQRHQAQRDAERRGAVGRHEHEVVCSHWNQQCRPAHSLRGYQMGTISY